MLANQDRKTFLAYRTCVKQWHGNSTTAAAANLDPNPDGRGMLGG